MAPAISAKIITRGNVREVIFPLLGSGLLYCFFEDVVFHPKVNYSI
jgi:hypothetical protein